MDDVLARMTAALAGAQALIPALAEQAAKRERFMAQAQAWADANVRSIWYVGGRADQAAHADYRPGAVWMGVREGGLAGGAARAGGAEGAAG